VAVRWGEVAVLVGLSGSPVGVLVGDAVALALAVAVGAPGRVGVAVAEAVALGDAVAVALGGTVPVTVGVGVLGIGDWVLVGVAVRVALAVGVAVRVTVAVGVAVRVAVGVGVAVAGRLSQNLLPVSPLPSSGAAYSIQLAVRTVPPTLVAPAER
jgi:hypothetical protein